MTDKADAAIEKMGVRIDGAMVIHDMPVGHKQFTEIARELSKEQLKLLILDEPTAGLDPKERLRLRQYISDLAKNKIVFLTTHIVSDIESIANDVLLMKQGELVSHSAPDTLIAEVRGRDLEDVYMAYLGVD